MGEGAGRGNTYPLKMSQYLSVHAAVLEMDEQQGRPVERMGLSSVLCGSPDGRDE